jgi:hypothetical protein
MGKANFKKYIWMLDTIYRTGGISKKELIRRWEESPLNDRHKTIAERTFRKDIRTIEEIFDVNIGCNASNKYKYFIEDSAELSKGIVKNWLLTSFSINNMMAESKQLNNHILFEQIPCGNEFLPTIVQAIKENVSLKLTRQGFGSEKAYTITMKPYGIKVFKQRWYIVGVPNNSEQIKNYALDRTLKLELTDEHFDMPENFDLSTHFYNSYGVYTDDLEDHPVDTIRIKADNQQRYYLRTLPLHHSQKEVERTKDYSIFEVKLSPSYDFIYEILSKGDGVEILAPKWFREEIASYVRAMHRSYKDTIEVLNQRDEKLFTTVKRACHSSKELSSLQ